MLAISETEEIQTTLSGLSSRDISIIVIKKPGVSITSNEAENTQLIQGAYHGREGRVNDFSKRHILHFKEEHTEDDSA